MYKSELEVFSDKTNQAMVRMPGRQFPGVVIQGDTLSMLYGHLKTVRDRAARTDDEKLKDGATIAFRMLDNLVRHYERVLDEHNIEIPYHPDSVLKDLVDWQRKDD